MGWFRGFLWGGIIGAGIALLTTKRTGEENRQMLMDKGQEYMDKAMDYRDKAGDMVNNARDKATQAVNTVASKATQVADQANAQVHQTANQARDMANNIPQTGSGSHSHSGMNPGANIPDTGSMSSGSMRDQDRESLTDWTDTTPMGDETSDRPTGNDPLIDPNNERDYDV